MARSGPPHDEREGACAFVLLCSAGLVGATPSIGRAPGGEFGESALDQFVFQVEHLGAWNARIRCIDDDLRKAKVGICGPVVAEQVENSVDTFGVAQGRPLDARRCIRLRSRREWWARGEGYP